MPCSAVRVATGGRGFGRSTCRGLGALTQDTHTLRVAPIYEPSWKERGSAREKEEHQNGKKKRTTSSSMEHAVSLASCNSKS